DEMITTRRRAGVVSARSVRSNPLRHGARGATMLQRNGFNRRAFLRNASLSALAVGVSGAPAAAAGVAPPDDPRNGKYDFDTPYDRHGTNCTKWDRPSNMYGKDKVAVGMGIADMDFRTAPCITRALNERMKHENWGYLDSTRPYIESVVKWN